MTASTLERVGIYRGRVSSYDVESGVALCTIDQLYGNTLITVEPMVATSAEIIDLTPLNVGDALWVFFEGGQDSRPMWLEPTRPPADIIPGLTVEGTYRQVLVNDTYDEPLTGALKLTLPQGIAADSTPQFGRLTLDHPAGAIVDMRVSGVQKWLVNAMPSGGLSIDDMTNGGRQHIGLSPGSDEFTAITTINSWTHVMGPLVAYDYLNFKGGVVGEGLAWLDARYLRKVGGTITGSLIVTGNISAGGSVDAVNGTFSGELSADGDINANANVIVGGTLYGDDASFTGDVTAANFTATGVSATISGNFHVLGNTTLDGTLTFGSVVGTGLTWLDARYANTTGDTFTGPVIVNSSIDFDSVSGDGLAWLDNRYVNHTDTNYVKSVSGTASQVFVNGTWATPQAGDLTLALPQDIAATSMPHFAAIRLNNAIAPAAGQLRIGGTTPGVYFDRGAVNEWLVYQSGSTTFYIRDVVNAKMHITMTPGTVTTATTRFDSLVGVGMTPVRNMDITGTLGATGATTLGSTLDVAALATFSGNVVIANNQTTPLTFNRLDGTGEHRIEMKQAGTTKLFVGILNTSGNGIFNGGVGSGGVIRAETDLYIMTGLGTHAMHIDGTNRHVGIGVGTAAAPSRLTIVGGAASDQQRIQIGFSTTDHFYTIGRNPSSGFLNFESTITAPIGTAKGVTFDSLIGSPVYASQTTGWRITELGAADFRYLYADEMHVKVFIADLEQALAGGQIIAKSVTFTFAAFTVPAAGATSPLIVKDLPSAAGMQVFQPGDTVALREFNRSGGSLAVTWCAGTVSAPVINPANGTQTWTFTRLTGAGGGASTTGTIISADSIILDFGVAGNGYVETTTVDGMYGANSPYQQIVTWTGSPVPAAGGLTVRSRVGRLNGITGDSTEWGAIFGGWTASPKYDTRFLRASNAAFDMVGMDLRMFDYASGTGTVQVFGVARNGGYPYLGLGNPLPTTFGGSVSGFWMGSDAGVYKMRVGNPAVAGSRMEWTGTAVAVHNADISLYTGTTRTIFLEASTANIVVGSDTNKITIDGTTDQTTSAIYSGTTTYTTGTGFFMAADGKVRFGSTTQYVRWTGSALEIVGDVAITGGTTGLSAGVSPNWFRVDTSGNIWSGRDTFVNAAATFRVSNAGVLTAASGTIGGWSLTTTSITSASSLVTLNNAGNISVGSTTKITITGGTTGPTTTLASGTTTYAAGTGFFMDADGKMRFGSTTAYVRWTGSALEITGSITGGTLSIGTSPNWFRVDASGNIWSGAVDFAGAASTFRVSSAGVLTAASGTIAGLTITATKIYTGAGAYATAGTNFYLDNNGYFSLGPNFYWNPTAGGSLVITGTVTSTAFINGAGMEVLNAVITAGTFRTSAVTTDARIVISGNDITLYQKNYPTDTAEIKFQQADGTTGQYGRIWGDSGISISSATNAEFIVGSYAGAAEFSWYNVGVGLMMSFGVATLGYPLLNLQGRLWARGADFYDTVNNTVKVNIQAAPGQVSDLMRFIGSDGSTIMSRISADGTFHGTFTGSYVGSVSWANVTSKPSPVVTVTLSGAVTGSGSATLTDVGNGTAFVSTSYDYVTLDTRYVNHTDNYVQTLQGTANQVLVSGTSGTPVTGGVTLTTPQNIHTAATPQFAGMTLTGALSGTSATFSTTLGVTGTSTLAALTATTGGFSSNVTVGGTLNVTGITTLGTLSSGAITITSAAAQLKIQSTVASSGWIAFYNDITSLTTRSGYVGYAGTLDMRVINERTGGNLLLMVESATKLTLSPTLAAFVPQLTAKSVASRNGVCDMGDIGGWLGSGTANTGSWKIKTPWLGSTAGKWVHLEIRCYNYSSARPLLVYRISGYKYSSGFLNHAVTVECVDQDGSVPGAAPNAIPVLRWGIDPAGDWCIAIDDNTGNWAYGQIYMRMMRYGATAASEFDPDSWEVTWNPLSDIVTTEAWTQLVTPALGRMVNTRGDTMTGPLVLPTGSAAAPSLGLGAANYGIYNSGTTFGFTFAGVNKWTMNDTYFIGGSNAAAINQAAGTAAAPTFSVNGNLNTGVYFPALNQVGISAGGSVSATFSSTGVLIPGTLGVTGAVSFNTTLTVTGNTTLNSLLKVEHDSATLATFNRPNATAASQMELQQNGVNRIHWGFTDSTGVGGGVATNGLPNAGYMRAAQGLHLSVSTNGAGGITINAGNNIGIGTSAPTRKLDVVGTMGVTGAVTFDTSLTIGNDVATPLTLNRLDGLGEQQIRLQQAGTTKLWMAILNTSGNGIFNGGVPSAAVIRAEAGLYFLRTGGNYMMHMEGATGNIGIGTGLTAPSGILDIEGVTPTVYITTKADTQEAKLMFADTTNNAGGFTYAHATDMFSIRTGAIDRFFIDATGQVGINRSVPGATLDVAAQAPSIPTIRLRNLQNDSLWTDEQTWGSIEWFTSDASGIGVHTAAFINVVNDQATTAGPSGTLSFGTGAYNTAATEKMRLTSSQLLVPSGSAAAPGLAFLAASNYGMLLNGANVDFSLAGVAHWRMNTTPYFYGPNNTDPALRGGGLGTSTAPHYTFTANTGVGMFLNGHGSNEIGWSTNSLPRLLMGNTIFKTPDYASQTIGWGITHLGAADFRYLYADEMHVKIFIADIEQALAGAQIIAKSVTFTTLPFSVPALAGGTATMTVDDLPSAAGMQVFQPGDTVAIREFSRAGGSLAVTWCAGTVSAPVNNGNGTQSWLFTRLAGAGGGAATSPGTIAAKSIVLDFGVPGNGYVETTTVDGMYGANSPYQQVVSWTGSPVPAAGGLTVRTRVGRLTGITGDTTEWGAVFGGWSAAPSDTHRFVRMSSAAFDIVGVDFRMYKGSVNVFKIDRTKPYMALGTTTTGAPADFAGTTVGFWTGIDTADANKFKWRVGDPLGQRIEWTGTALNVYGAIKGTTTIDIGTDPNGFHVDANGNMWLGTSVGGYASNLSFRVSNAGALDIGGMDSTSFHVNDTGDTWIGASTFATAPWSVSNTGNMDVGFTSAGDNTSWHVDNAGNMWSGNATFAGAAATFRVSNTGSLVAALGLIANWTIATNTLTGGSITLSSTGDITVGTVNNVLRISTTNADIAPGPYRLWAGHATATSAPFRVSQAGAIWATLGNIGGWTIAATTITGGNAILNSTGVLSLGTGTQMFTATAVDATWRLAIGHSTLASAPFRVDLNGSFVATTGVVGNWTVDASNIRSITGTNPVALRTTWSYLAPGATNSNWFQIADAAPLNVGTNAFRLQARVFLNTNAVNRVLISKYGGAAARCWAWHIDTSDRQVFVWSNDGTATAVANVLSAGMSAYENSWVWLTMDYDPVANGGNYRVTFYVDPESYAPPASPTVLTTFNGAVPGGTIFNAARFVTLGNNNQFTAGTGWAGTTPDGRIYRLRMENLTTPAVLFDVNFTTQAAGTTSFTEDGPNLYTVTRTGVNVNIVSQPAITIGAGSFTGADTPFMASADGVFALGNKLIFRGGNLTITGNISATTGTIGGYTIGATALTAGTGSNQIGMDSGLTNPAFYAGSSGTHTAALFRVSNAGYLVAASGTIGGINMTATKLYVGAGNYATSDTPLYVDNGGYFSLKNTLYWNPSTNVLTVGGTLTVGGLLEVASGAATPIRLGVNAYAAWGSGWNGLVLDQYNYILKNASTATGNFRVGNAANYILWSGGSVIDFAGAITSTAEITGGTITGATYRTSAAAAERVVISPNARIDIYSNQDYSAAARIQFNLSNAGYNAVINSNGYLSMGGTTGIVMSGGGNSLSVFAAGGSFSGSQSFNFGGPVLAGGYLSAAGDTIRLGYWPNNASYSALYRIGGAANNYMIMSDTNHTFISSPSASGGVFLRAGNNGTYCINVNSDGTHTMVGHLDMGGYVLVTGDVRLNGWSDTNTRIYNSGTYGGPLVSGYTGVAIYTATNGRVWHFFNDGYCYGPFAGWAGSSSITIKKNVEALALDRARDQIRRLRPVSYDHKDGSNDQRLLGFVAEWTRDVIPEAVRQPPTEAGGVLSIVSDRLVPVLTAAVQSIDQEVLALRAEKEQHAALLAQMEHDNDELAVVVYKLTQQVEALQHDVAALAGTGGET